MVRHIVLLKWKDSASLQQLAAVDGACEEFFQSIPQIRRFQYGPNIGPYKGNSDYAMVLDFDNTQALHAYVVCEEHRAFMRRVTLPIMESFQAIQIDHPSTRLRPEPLAS